MTKKKYPVFPNDNSRMAKSKKIYLAGNKIIWDDKDAVFKYKDGTSTTKEKIKPCPVCGEHQIDGCDPCLGKLPGVISACCGHGVKPGYVIFENGIKIKGTFKVSKETLPLKGQWW